MYQVASQSADRCAGVHHFPPARHSTTQTSTHARLLPQNADRARGHRRTDATLRNAAYPTQRLSACSGTAPRYRARQREAAPRPHPSAPAVRRGPGGIGAFVKAAGIAPRAQRSQFQGRVLAQAQYHARKRAADSSADCEEPQPPGTQSHPNSWVSFLPFAHYTPAPFRRRDHRATRCLRHSQHRAILESRASSWTADEKVQSHVIRIPSLRWYARGGQRAASKHLCRPTNSRA